MKKFSRQESIVVTIIFLGVFLVTGYNLNIAVRRARDAQRRSDLSAITNALEKFNEEFGYYPPAEEGKIVMCKGENYEEVIDELSQIKPFDREFFFSGLRGCDWGWDSLSDPQDTEHEQYLKSIPADPKHNEGIDYLYVSNTRRFQIFSFLEGKSTEIGYSEDIVSRGLLCGKEICSFGKEIDAPLDKSIEEHEAELLKNSGQ